MQATTNHLVTKAKKLSVPASIAAAFVLGAAFFAGHGPVRAASATPLDDDSVSALTSIDHAMETVASKVTPAVVNVAVTSRGPSEEQVLRRRSGPRPRAGPGSRPDAAIASRTAPVLRQHASPDARQAAARARRGQRRNHFARRLHRNQQPRGRRRHPDPRDAQRPPRAECQGGRHRQARPTWQ